MWRKRGRGRSRFESLLMGLQHADRFTHSRLLREMSVVLNEEGEYEEAITLLLEYLTSACGIEICSKLFYLLSAAIANNPEVYERVASCPDVYEVACRVISKGLAERTVSALVLLATLAGGGEGAAGARHAIVAEYARGRVRVSGCLNAMIQLFFKDVMYARLWRELCTSLAMCCTHCEPNQTACSHLVPPCIERCSGEGSDEALQLLQALLEGHEGNRDLFLQCRGITIFTRRVLARREGAGLLTVLVQGSPCAARCAYDAALPQTLVQLITTHGAQSQVGQWCSVCLHHITAGLRKQESSQDKNKIQEKRSSNFNDLSLMEIEEDAINDNIDDNFDKNNYEINFNKKTVANDAFEKINAMWNYEIGPTIIIPDDDDDEKMPNFLKQKENNPKTYRNVSIGNKSASKNTSVSSFTQTSKSLFVKNTSQDKSCQTWFDEAKCSPTKSTQTMNDSTLLPAFVPLRVSTPLRDAHPPQKRTNFSEKQNLPTKHNSTRKSDIKSHYNGRRGAPYPRQPKSGSPIISPNTVKYAEPTTEAETVKNSSKATRKQTENQSLGSKIFKSFNASCSSVIDTFKGYILPEKAQPRNETASHKNLHGGNGNMSFTNFMKSRELNVRRFERYKDMDFSHITAIEQSDESSVEKMSYTSYSRTSCRTCNDTAMLQKKLNGNQQLKETVDQLKIGIGLYGCDFKKIAKKYWPKETYMTPATLYNLYRKLIVKKPSTK